MLPQNVKFTQLEVCILKGVSWSRVPWGLLIMWMKCFAQKKNNKYVEKCLFSTLILKSRNRLFLLQTVRIIIAYRKPYQHPFAIACFECCDNIIKIKPSFPDKAKQNNLLTVDAVRSSIASSFNKCFFVNSPWHCASFTKQKALNNPQTRSGMPLKNSPLVPYAGILLISVQRCERAVWTKRVKANVLSIHLTWKQTRVWTQIFILYPV